MEEIDSKFHFHNFCDRIWVIPLANSFYFLIGVATHGDHQSQYLMGELIEKALIASPFYG